MALAGVNVQAQARVLNLRWKTLRTPFLFLCLISSSPLLALIASLLSFLYSVLPAFPSLPQLIPSHLCKVKGRLCGLASPEKYEEHKCTAGKGDTAETKARAGTGG